MSSTSVHDQRDSRRVFPALDTLRLFGATAVVATHAAFWTGTYTTAGLGGNLLARMDVGVALFFVLSGFLLSRDWIVRAADGRSDPPLGGYFLRRVLRIMPVYVLTAVLALAFIRDNRDMGVGDWVTTLLLLDIYVNPSLPSGLTQMWSLATEVAFYVVLPFLMAALVGRRLRPRRVVAGLLLLALLTLVWHLALVERVPGAEGRSPREWLPSYLIWFGLGIGLALLEVLHGLGRLSPRWNARIAAAAGAPGALWMVAGGLLLVATTGLAGPILLIEPTNTQALTKNLLYAAIGALVVFTGVFTTPGSRYVAILSRPLGRHLGHTSYALFCIHLPVMHLLKWILGYELFTGGFLWFFALTMVVSLIASELLYRLVEKPFMRLKNLRRPPSPNASTANSPAAAPSANSTS